MNVKSQALTYVFSIIFDECESQKVQVVLPWLVQESPSFVDVKLADHMLAWAHNMVKTTVRKNVEEPAQHFQNYGNFSGKIGSAPLFKVHLCSAFIFIFYS